MASCLTYFVVEIISCFTRNIDVVVGKGSAERPAIADGVALESLESNVRGMRVKCADKGPVK